MASSSLPGMYSPISGTVGQQQLTTITATAGATLTVPTGAQLAYVQASAQPVIWTWNGSVPSTTNGTTLASGDSFAFVGNLSSLRFLQTTTGAILNVGYYK